MLAEALISVKFLQSRQRASASATLVQNFSTASARDDRFISILLVIAAGDQRGANTCEETDFVIDGSSIGLECAKACRPSALRNRALPTNRSNQIDGLVGQPGGEIYANRHHVACRRWRS